MRFELNSNVASELRLVPRLALSVQTYFLSKHCRDRSAPSISRQAMAATAGAAARVILRMASAVGPCQTSAPPSCAQRSGHDTYPSHRRQPADGVSWRVMPGLCSSTGHRPENWWGVGTIVLGPVFVVMCPLRRRGSCASSEAISCLSACLHDGIADDGCFPAILAPTAVLYELKGRVSSGLAPPRCVA